MHKLVIDPITRIEGHMAVEVMVDDSIVKEAKSSGTLFRGLELILEGRDPRDANRLTQRICGVCPASHSKGSAMCLDSAFNINDKIPENGRIIRNLILGSNFLQSHILHFYHLTALDYVDTKETVGELHPFMPRYEGDYRLPKEINQKAVNHYLTALDIRRKSHEMLALFGGKMPHNIGIVPGGVTEKPTEDKITSFLWRLNEIREFIDNSYIPDVIAVAKVYSDYFGIGRGCGNLLDYGGFELADGMLFKPGVVSEKLELNEFTSDNITEDVKYSWYINSTSGKNPQQGDTSPEPEKKQGYSFIKSPRYESKVYEVGPLARMVINYAQGDETIKAMINQVLAEFSAEPDVLFSVLGRHAARAIECKVVADAMADWVLELKPDEPIIVEYEIPQESEGAGLTAAPRGCLGHWISIKDKKIKRYQVITPTAWNASPKDDRDQPGPIEQSLIGTKIKDEENPFEIVRIIRSFDPCLACSVHLITAKREKLGVFKVV
jgi:hydrogenase large subunit